MIASLLPCFYLIYCTSVLSTVFFLIFFLEKAWKVFSLALTMKWLCASGLDLPPGNVCRTKTLICLVIRSDSTCFFHGKINSVFRAFYWCLYWNTSIFSPLNSVLCKSSKLINPNWPLLKQDYKYSSRPNLQRVFSVPTTYSFTTSSPIKHTYSCRDKLVYRHQWRQEKLSFKLHCEKLASDLPFFSLALITCQNIHIYVITVRSTAKKKSVNLSHNFSPKT